MAITVEQKRGPSDSGYPPSEDRSGLRECELILLGPSGFAWAAIPIESRDKTILLTGLCDNSQSEVKSFCTSSALLT